MLVHLIDGTYELFRHFYGAPPHRSGDRELGAVRSAVGSIVGLVEGGATHVAVATDHVIESFRNDLWPEYKTGTRIEPSLREQFEPLERALTAAGVAVWAMTEVEADDALASGALTASRDPAVSQVLICSPDKDLAQCVEGVRIVQLDRRAETVRDEAGVFDRFGVVPASIPDYLALVGDTADGFPGLAGWGAKSAAAVLSAYRHIESIPASPDAWTVRVRGAARLSAELEANRGLAGLFRTLATLRTDVPVLRGGVAAIRWPSSVPDPDALATETDSPALAMRVTRLAASRAGR